MEPEIIAVMGTVIAAMAAALGKMSLNNRNNNRPKDDAHHGNPSGVVDLRTTKLGDMSAAWYEEKHKEILVALDTLAKAVRGESA